MSDISAFEGTHGSPTEEVDRFPLNLEGTDADLSSIRGTPVHRDRPADESSSDNFTTRHEESVPVWQRATNEWDGVPTLVGQNPITVVGRRRGRRQVTFWVPTAYVTPSGVAQTPLGVQIARSPSNLASNTGLQLNPGDSITLETEAPVYVQCLPGQTSGLVFYSELYNEVGGPLTP